MAALRREGSTNYDILVGITGQVAAAEALRPLEHVDLERLEMAARLLISARKNGLDGSKVELEARRLEVEERRLELEIALRRRRLDEDVAEIAANAKLSDGEKVLAIRDQIYGTPGAPR
jgi:hypothetical protein